MSSVVLFLLLNLICWTWSANVLKEFSLSPNPQSVSRSLSFATASRLAETFLAQRVLITQIHLHKSTSKYRTIDVLIDSSVSDVLLEVNADLKKPEIELYDTNGLPWLLEDSNTTLISRGQHWIIVHISQPPAGNWTVQIHDGQSYNITVLGDSPNRFSVKFINQTTGTELYEQLISGSKVMVEISLFTANPLRNDSVLCVTTPRGVELHRYSLGHPRGHGRNIYVVEVTVPEEVFRLRIVGTMADNSSLSRINDDIYHPKTFSIKLSPSMSDIMMSGSVFNFTLLVHNYKSTVDSFHIIAFVQNTKHQKKLLSSKPSVLKILAHSTDSSFIMYRFPKDIPSGSKIKIYVMVNNSRGSVQGQNKTVTIQTDTHQYVESTHKTIFHVTRTTNMGSVFTKTPNKFNSVSKMSTFNPIHSSDTKHKVTSHKHHRSTNPTDINPPFFHMISFKDKCNNHKRCSLNQWIVYFKVQDNESGIHRIDVEDRTSSSVITERFQDGKANTPIHGNVSTTCCNGATVIIVEDKQGNRGRYRVKYADHVQRNNPKQPESSIKEYSGVVVGSLASLMVIVIIIASLIQFHKRCQQKNVRRYEQSIGGKTIPRSMFSRSGLAHVV